MSICKLHFQLNFEWFHFEVFVLLWWFLKLRRWPDVARKFMVVRCGIFEKWTEYTLFFLACIDSPVFRGDLVDISLKWKELWKIITRERLCNAEKTPPKSTRGNIPQIEFQILIYFCQKFRINIIVFCPYLSFIIFFYHNTWRKITFTDLSELSRRFFLKISEYWQLSFQNWSIKFFFKNLKFFNAAKKE